MLILSGVALCCLFYSCVMYPMPHNVCTAQWIRAQVAAKCGVSNGQQLTDSLLHLITLDSNLCNLDIVPSNSNTLPSAHISSLPYSTQLQEGNSSRTLLAELLSSANQSNGYSTNNSHLYNISANSLSSGKCCGNFGVSGVGEASSVGVATDIRQEVGCQPQVERAIQYFCNLELKGNNSPRSSSLSSSDREQSGPSWLSRAHVRMVAPSRGQNTTNVTRQNGNNSSKSSANKNLVIKNNNNNTTNNNNNNNNSNKKNKNIKNSEVVDCQENKCCTANNKSEKAARKNCSAPAATNSKDGVDEQQQQQQQQQQQPASGVPSSSKGVSAKEVEKLLQDALWKTHEEQQQKKKSDERAESVSSGGCDTGYSSRCSTPSNPPLSLPPSEPTTSPVDPKQGTKRHLDVPVNTGGTRESRSESPSASSISSQGSYRNPRPKRRYNNAVEGFANHHPNDSHYHHNRRQHHNQQQQYTDHYSYNHQGNGYGGGCGRGNNHYYHYYVDLAARDCTNYQGRRYDRGYNNSGYQRHYDYYNRELNYYNGGHRYNNHGRGGYNNRYQNNNRNYYNDDFPPLINGSVRDQSKPILSDRAGTFSNECTSDNKQWKCEVVNTPKELLTGSEWDNLSKQVWDFFRKHQQTDKTFLKKLKLKDKIFKVIRNVLPMCRLYVVGSSLSGFGADWSDVDMCLMVAPGDLDQRTEATAVLRLLQRELNNCGSIQKMELIRAKVPILKFRDAQSQVDVDLNCNNSVGIRNTHLLHSYSQLDWRVRPLVLVAKLWAQHHNINNAKDMTISSYSLVLMVIHFLQHGVEPPVLPCLQKCYPEKFHAHAHIMSIPITEKMPTFTSKNHDTLGQLFHGFLNYFANTFTYVEDTISIRTGGTIPTGHCRSVKSRKNDARMWKYLCIEEPFDLTNTARSMYDETAFERVKKVFADSYKLLNESRDLTSIM